MPSNTLKRDDLMAKCRQRVDMTNSKFVTDLELIGYINLAMADLHDILVTSYEDYYISDTDYAVPGSNPGTLPADFYKALGVDLSMNGSFDGSSITYRLRPYSFQERNAYSNPLMTAAVFTNTFYNIRGNEIHFIPNPTVGGVIRLYYIPEASYFVEDMSLPEYNKEIKDIAPAVAIGWEEFLILSTCVKMVMKEEGDPSALYKLLGDVRKRLMVVTQNKDAGESTSISDVTTGTFQRNYINWM